MNRNYKNNKNNDENKPNKLDKPLSVIYKDKKKIFLEEGEAYKIANKMQDIPPHQLRKILNEVKKSVSMVKKNENDFENARNILYYVVPLTAYNAGRNPKIKVLYDFVYTHINAQTLQSKDDIIILDQLFTSIIAYHKLHSKKEK